MSHHPSWLDRALDTLKPQPGAPPRPHAPQANQRAWEDSVEQTHVVPDLTVCQIGLSVFGETRSLRDRPGSTGPLGSARQKIAHAMINDAELAHQTGRPRQTVHPPIEPSDQVKGEEHAAYESSLRAAREAYLSGHDPTDGATHFNMRPRPDRSNWKFKNGTPEGLSVSTLSGPYDNSFPNKNVPAHTTWVNTYLPGENEKRSHKK